MGLRRLRIGQPLLVVFRRKPLLVANLNCNTADLDLSVCVCVFVHGWVSHRWIDRTLV